MGRWADRLTVIFGTRDRVGTSLHWKNGIFRMLRYHMKYSVAILLLLALLALLGVGCGGRAWDYEQVSKEERIVIKFSHVVAENTPKGLAAQRYAKLVKERTGGRVEVQVYPNSVLYKDGEEMDALLEGNVQMIAPATSKISDLFPQWQLLDLPFLFNNYEDVRRTFDGPVGTQLLALLESKNMLGLAIWENGFKVMSANKPLRRVEDFRGLRFRIMPSKVLAAQFSRLGAVPIVFSFDQVYGALEQGLVDGLENPPSNLFSKRFHERQSHITVSNHGYIGYVVLVNRSFWESLPRDIRVILEETMAEVTQWEREVAREYNQQDLEWIRREGTSVIYHLTPRERDEWRRALMPVWRDFERVIGTDLIQGVLKARMETEL